MNQPDPNQFSGPGLPWVPGLWVMVAPSVLSSVFLTSTAFGFSDEGAHLQAQSRDRQELARRGGKDRRGEATVNVALVVSPMPKALASKPPPPEAKGKTSGVPPAQSHPAASAAAVLSR